MSCYKMIKKNYHGNFIDFFKQSFFIHYSKACISQCESCITVDSLFKMGLLSLLRVFLIIQIITTSVNGSCLDDYIGDDFCDDENNNPGCDHDGGITIQILICLQKD